MERVLVQLGERSYPVFVVSDGFASLGEIARSAKLPLTAVVISDSNVAGKYLLPVRNALRDHNIQVEAVIIPPGESQKSLRRYSNVVTSMLRKGIGRDSFVVALGGGVIGDLAGFVAATYMRGLPYVQVPTTLLAQVDSSVGGKVGIDHRLGKNLIGAFYQPQFVYANLATLTTLSKREIISGLGEVIKYGVIASETIFNFVETQLDAILASSLEALAWLIPRCVAIKADIVAADEREAGRRMVLNFGHTIAHGLEAATRYSRMRHGEAVLIGMLGETYLAVQRGLTDGSLLDRLVHLVSRLSLKVDLAHIHMRNILKPLRLDKKVRRGALTFVLPRSVGVVEFVSDIGMDEIRASIEFLRAQFIHT